MVNKASCLVIGVLIGAFVTVWIMKERAHWLSGLAFELTQPSVPHSILSAVRTAESASYRQRSILRRAAEEAQDVMVFASPELAYRLNVSVGRYRMKAQTIEDLLPWAIAEGYVRLEETTPEQFAHALAYFSEQPSLNDWQAAAYLAWLKKDHPMMRDLAWAEIADDPHLVAKLYSGYMGAGGAWEEWRKDLTPGAVATERMGLNAATGTAQD